MYMLEFLFDLFKNLHYFLSEFHAVRKILRLMTSDYVIDKFLDAEIFHSIQNLYSVDTMWISQFSHTGS